MKKWEENANLQRSTINPINCKDQQLTEVGEEFRLVNEHKNNSNNIIQLEDNSEEIIIKEKSLIEQTETKNEFHENSNKILVDNVDYREDSLELVSNDIIYSENNVPILQLKFNHPIENESGVFPQELSEDISPKFFPKLWCLWQLSAPDTLLGYYEEIISSSVITVTIEPKTLRSTKETKDCFGNLHRIVNNKKITFRFIEKPKFSIYVPNIRNEIFPRAVFAIQIENLDVESILKYLDCYCNEQLYTLCETSFDEFKKQFVYSGRYFPQPLLDLVTWEYSGDIPAMEESNIVYPELNENRLPFSLQLETIFLRPEIPFDLSAPIRITLRREYWQNVRNLYHKNDLHFSYTVFTSNTVSLRPNYEFFLGQPIAETREESIEILSREVKLTPHIPGFWSTPNNFYFKYNSEISYQKIKLSAPNEIKSIFGVPIYFKDYFKVPLLLQFTNIYLFDLEKFPSKPQIYFEFNQPVNRDSVLKSISLSRKSMIILKNMGEKEFEKRKCTFRILEDHEINCPSIPNSNCPPEFRVCISPVKYLERVNYQFKVSKKIVSIHGIRCDFSCDTPVQVGEKFTVKLKRNTLIFSQPLHDDFVYDPFITPTPLQPLGKDFHVKFFLPNTEYTFNINSTIRSKYFHQLVEKTIKFVPNKNKILKMDVHHNYKYLDLIQISPLPQILFQFTEEINFQLLAPYLSIEVTPNVEKKEFTISEVESNSIHSHLRSIYSLRVTKSIVIKITPEIPRLNYVTLRISGIPCSLGSYVTPKVKKYKFQVAEELDLLDSAQTYIDDKTPIILSFNQPLYYHKLGDMNNILLKAGTGVENNMKYINPYYCPIITPNVFGHWEYRQTRNYIHVYTEMFNNEIRTLNNNALNAIKFIPSRPLKLGSCYDMEILPYRMLSILSPLTKPIKLHFEVGKMLIVDYYPRTVKDLMPPNPIFFLKFNYKVDCNSIIELCSVNNNRNIVQFGMATEQEMEAIDKDMKIRNTFDPKCSNVVVIVDRSTYELGENRILTIKSGPVSNKPYRLPLKTSLSIPFRIQRKFSYLYLDPPKSTEIRMSSLIALDDDSIILYFSEILSPEQIEFPIITPALEGEWIVQNNTLIYRPIDLWMTGTCYTIKLQKSLQSIHGNYLPKIMNVKFEIGVPYPVVKSPPITSTIITGQTFLIRYGQPIDVQSVIEKSYFKYRSKLRTKIILSKLATEEEYLSTGTALSEENRIRDSGIEVLLAPSKYLPQNKKVYLVIGEGVKYLRVQGVSKEEISIGPFTTGPHFSITSISVPKPFVLNNSICKIKFSHQLGSLVNKDLPIIMWDLPEMRVLVKTLSNFEITFSVILVDDEFLIDECDLAIDLSNILSGSQNTTLLPKDIHFTIKVRYSLN